ncbi:MAG TPA: type II toxin-antitoxin system RelE/ParE family toxin [Gammaproteobacteria bacterium]|nr:type II toxin-antitoxin system RelE/ParE family toxin [Gammaproteobacteria bacterium]
MGRYRLSEAAVQDFDQIYDYGIDEFGIDQATIYQNRLKQRFAEIAETPLLYMAVDHIHSKHRRSVCGVHSIYYCINSDEIVIVRILGRQNPKKALKNRL